MRKQLEIAFLVGFLLRGEASWLTSNSSQLRQRNFDSRRKKSFILHCIVKTTIFRQFKFRRSKNPPNLGMYEIWRLYFRSFRSWILKVFNECKDMTLLKIIKWQTEYNSSNRFMFSFGFCDYQRIYRPDI